MLRILIAVYRANPLRPHCSETHHVTLCRWLGLEKRSRCTAKDN